MSIPVRQSTAYEFSIGPVLDADGVAFTSCVVADFEIKKTTGDFAALNGSATLADTGEGHYDMVLTTSDTDTVGALTIKIADGVNACQQVRLQVMEEAIYDALYAASANTFTGAAGSTKVTGVVLTDTVTTYTGNTPQTGDSYALANGASGFVAIKGDTAAILVDTNELQTDWVNGGRLDLIVDAILADTNELQTDWVNGGRLDLIIDAILAVTNELQTDWVNGGRLDLILDGILDDTDLIDDGTSGLAKIATDVAAILVDTGTTLDGLIDAIKAKTDNLPTDPADQSLIEAAITVVGNYVDTEVGAIKTVVDAIKVITDALGATAAARLALSAGQIIPGTVDTVTNTHTPTTTEFQADNITEATADHFNGRIVIFTSGALAGQATDITDYAAVGGIGQFTVTAMTEAPANNDSFIVV